MVSSILRGVLNAFFIRNLGFQSHLKLCKRLFFAQLNWFDSTPIGSIINRVSTDQIIVDTQLPVEIHSCLILGGLVIGASLVIVIIFPWYLFLIGGIVALIILFYALFIQGARDCKRL